jgi:hypothetical protein
MNTYQTQHGTVAVSIPYFSCDMETNVVELTLSKPASISKPVSRTASREIPAGLSITPELVELFAQEAALFI